MRKAYTKLELQALNFPAKFINKVSLSGTVTVGYHKPSGARIAANQYEAWSLARAIAWDVASLSSFTKLASKNLFNIDSIPTLREEILKVCEFNGIELGSNIIAL